jgi:hypothetical protein
MLEGNTAITTDRDLWTGAGGVPEKDGQEKKEIYRKAFHDCIKHNEHAAKWQCGKKVHVTRRDCNPTCPVSIGWIEQESRGASLAPSQPTT